MQRSIAERPAYEQHQRLIERLAFVEEQNIRRVLCPAYWQGLCDEIEKECKHANEVVPTFQVDRSPIVLSVRHLQKAATLRLEYVELDPCISVRETGRPVTNIVFGINATPAPSLIAMLNGIHRPQKLCPWRSVGVASSAPPQDVQ